MRSCFPRRAKTPAANLRIYGQQGQGRKQRKNISADEFLHRHLKALSLRRGGGWVRLVCHWKTACPQRDPGRGGGQEAQGARQRHRLGVGLGRYRCGPPGAQPGRRRPGQRRFGRRSCVNNLRTRPGAQLERAAQQTPSNSPCRRKTDCVGIVSGGRKTGSGSRRRVVAGPGPGKGRPIERRGRENSFPAVSCQGLTRRAVPVGLRIDRLRGSCVQPRAAGEAVRIGQRENRRVADKEQPQQVLPAHRPAQRAKTRQGACGGGDGRERSPKRRIKPACRAKSTAATARKRPRGPAGAALERGLHGRASKSAGRSSSRTSVMPAWPASAQRWARTWFSVALSIHRISVNLRDSRAARLQAERSVRHSIPPPAPPVLQKALPAKIDRHHHRRVVRPDEIFSVGERDFERGC